MVRTFQRKAIASMLALANSSRRTLEHCFLSATSEYATIQPSSGAPSSLQLTLRFPLGNKKVPANSNEIVNLKSVIVPKTNQKIKPTQLNTKRQRRKPDKDFENGSMTRKGRGQNGFSKEGNCLRYLVARTPRGRQAGNQGTVTQETHTHTLTRLWCDVWVCNQ